MEEFVLSAGSIIGLLLMIIGYFLNKLIHDIRKTQNECGKNKGRIELVEQQQINDIKRIEDRTQMQLSALTENVQKLSQNVNELVMILANNGIKR